MTLDEVNPPLYLIILLGTLRPFGKLMTGFTQTIQSIHVGRTLYIFTYLTLDVILYYTHVAQKVI